MLESVICIRCGTEHKKQDVKIISEFEDELERDNVVFYCPACKTRQSSLLHR